MTGQTLGHYKILDKLGAGGMGEVYRAEDTTLDREVALKILPPELAESQERLDRFEREAKTLAALDHPNIVTIHTVEEADGVRFLTMQLVEGKPLSHLIPKGGMPLERIFDIAIPLADALATAHEKGVVHRDLKPANIMVTDEGRVKVLDFGLAKLRQEAETPLVSEAPTEPLTEEGKIVGTMPYMSPEQLEGKEIDARSDIFSLGVVLYEMATGQRPFSGETSISLISSIVRDTPVTVDTLREELPHHLARVIAHCLEKNPKRRYQSAIDVHNELDSLKNEIESGVLRQSSAEAARIGLSQGRRPWPTFSAVAALVLVIAVLWIALRPRTPIREGREITSLAVLPLENLSGDPDQEFFSDGLTEALISQLAKIEALRVISRQSVMRYKDSDRPLPEIAEDLDVEALVEGSVTRSGDQVRITAKLIAAAPERHLWTETYDRDLRDILSVQSQAAQEIARQIHVTLTPEDLARLSTIRTVDPEAHEAYLRGRHFQLTYSEEGLQQAVDFFSQSIAQDPDYAPAYAGLADSYSIMGNFAYLPPGEAGPNAREAAAKAVELDELLAEAHSALGTAEFMFDWRMISARARYRRALELNPGDLATLWGSFFFLAIVGDFQQSLELGQRALRLDPVTATVSTDLGFCLFIMQRYEDAIEQIERSLPLNPENVWGLITLASSLSKLGRHEEAVKVAEEIVSLAPENQQPLAVAAWVLGQAGQHRRARGFSDRLTRLGQARWVDPTYEAVALAGRGEVDRALERLERGYDERSPQITWIKHLPWFDPLRDDPRFQDLLRRLHFPE